MNVNIHTNFFSKEDFDKVVTFSNEVEDCANRYAKGNWSEKLTLGRGNVHIYDCDDDEHISQIITKYIKDKLNRVPKVIMFYFWQPESFISWHNDSTHNGGATIYLNEEWDIDNGGLFMCNINGNIVGIPPEPNKCISQEGGVPHSTTSTHWNAPVRKSIQVFF